MYIMKCLSIRQPWASLIGSGQKTIELRTRRTHYRGPLVICASGRPRLGTDYPIGPLGVSICIVELVDCRPAVPDDASAACVATSEGEFSWVLRLIRSLSAVPVKGQLSMFEPPEELVRYL